MDVNDGASTSTEHPSASSRSCAKAIRSNSVRPGSTSTIETVAAEEFDQQLAQLRVVVDDQN
jgi:hypothetical protein